MAPITFYWASDSREGAERSEWGAGSWGEEEAQEWGLTGERQRRGGTSGEGAVRGGASMEWRGKGGAMPSSGVRNKGRGNIGAGRKGPQT